MALEISTIEQSVTMDDVRRMEVFLTLASCNIKKQDGSPLFTFKNGKLVDRDAFEKSWALLPPQCSEEIHEFVLSHNKLWSAEGEVLPNKESETSEIVWSISGQRNEYKLGATGKVPVEPDALF